MKKTLLTLVLAFCVLAGQGQTSTTASGVNTTELNSKWAQFTQLAEKKQYTLIPQHYYKIFFLST